jgi:hypothetical protein
MDVDGVFGKDYLAACGRVYADTAAGDFGVAEFVGQGDAGIDGWNGTSEMNWNFVENRMKYLQITSSF